MTVRPPPHPSKSRRPHPSFLRASDSAPAPDVPPHAAPPTHPALPAAPPGCRGPGAAPRACATLAAARCSSAARRHGRVSPAPARSAPCTVPRRPRPRVALRQVRGDEAAEGWATGPGVVVMLGSGDPSRSRVWSDMASLRMVFA